MKRIGTVKIGYKKITAGIHLEHCLSHSLFYFHAMWKIKKTYGYKYTVGNCNTVPRKQRIPTEPGVTFI
jgi:hypothetical protein